jgi:hypothetical protein
MSHQRAEEKALSNNTLSAITPEILADANIGVGADGSIGLIGMFGIRPFSTHLAPPMSSNGSVVAGSASNLAADSAASGDALDVMFDCPLARFQALTPVKYGYLVKQGHSVKNWKRRLCAIHGKYLYYYTEEDDRAPRGVLLLDNCVVRDELTIAKERKTNCFSVTAAKSWNVATRHAFYDRTYYFCLASLMEMNDWMAYLSTAATNLPRHAGEPLF